MAIPEIVDRAEWLVAGEALLAREKELTRARDAVSAERRRLPMVRIEKDYVFTGRKGAATLLDLFEGRDQLILTPLHVRPVLEPGVTELYRRRRRGVPWPARAPAHPRHHPGVLLARAPIEKIERYKAERGWDVPVVVVLRRRPQRGLPRHAGDPAQAPVMYNYRSVEEWESLGARCPSRRAARRNSPGDSVFLRVGDEVFHTYSDFGRGHGVDRWLLRLPRPDAVRTPGGVGGAQGRADLVRAERPDFAS